MTNNPPKVIVNHRFLLSKNSSKKKFNYDKKLMRKVYKMFDYYSNIEKRALFMFDYYRGDFGKNEKMNILFENGKYATYEEVEKRKKEYGKYMEESNLYQFIISFDNDYILKHVSIHELEQKIIKDVIPKFVSKCGFLNLSDMSYQVSCHTDTDNLHFHFSMAEKKPNYCTRKGEIKYRKKGKLSIKELDYLKMQTAIAIERETAIKPMTIKLNKEIDELKKYFNPNEKNFILQNKEDFFLEEKLLKLGKLLYIHKKKEDKYSGKLKYNSIHDKEIKDLTKDIKRYIFKNKNSQLYKQKESFNSSIKQINNYFLQLKADNHISDIVNKKEKFVLDKEKYLDNYIFNAIVNHAQRSYYNNRKKSISDNEIIHSIAYGNYRKNPNYNKYNVLKNYFSSSPSSSMRFLNKYKIEKAVKNLNYEMDQAAQMFSELFDSSNYINNEHNL